MSKCILHIGPHKTGSSSIQSTLHKNRMILEDYDVNYLKAKKANHSFLISSAFCSREYDDYHSKVKQGGSIPFGGYRRENSLNILEEAINNNTSSYFIISAEDISAFHPRELMQLKSFLDAHFDTTIVIGFVRPPMSFVTSYSQMILKRKGTYSYFCKTPLVANYRRYFDKFYSIWGDDNVTLRLFSPKVFSNNCVVSEFLDIIGLDKDLYKQFEVHIKNESISIPAAKIISLFRENAGDMDKAVYKSISQKLLRLKGEKYFLPPKILKKSLLLSHKDIHWVETKINCSLSDFDISPMSSASSMPLSEFNVISEDDVKSLLNEYCSLVQSA